MIEPVPTRLLEELAARRPADPPRGTRSRGGHPDIDVRAWCGVHGIAIRREKPWVNGAMVFELETCVFNADHNRGEAAIIKLATGMLLYKCRHQSCAGKAWADLRELFEPGAARRAARGTRRTERTKPPTAADNDDTIHLSDVGNARWLVADHGEDLRYCKPWKTWLVWDGRRWARDDRGQVMELAKAVTAEFFHEAAAAQDEATQRMLAGHALRSQRRAAAGHDPAGSERAGHPRAAHGTRYRPLPAQRLERDDRPADWLAPRAPAHRPDHEARPRRVHTRRAARTLGPLPE